MSIDLQTLWQQGQRHAEVQQWDKAIASYCSLVERDHSFLPAWMELSKLYEKLDAYRDAYHAVIEASRITNVPPMAALVVARSLRKFEDLPRLQDYVERTGLDTNIPPEKLIDLATFFSSAGDHSRAMLYTQQALKIRGDLAEAHHMLGLLLMFAGHTEQSAAAFERTLQLKPGFAAVYSTLSRVNKSTPANHHLDTLRRLLAQPGLSAKDEGHLAFALHNQLHDLCEYDEAWAALMRGCRARQLEQPYDHKNMMAIFDNLKATFDKSFIQGEVFDDPLTPIFIVGLHRSGTSLLERILSGHPDIADAGETYVFSAQLCYSANHMCKQITDEVIATRASNLDYTTIGRGFLDKMRRRSLGKSFITEKQNPNFILLGPIAKALTQAKILHMRRSPIDTCFSNLRMLFTNEAAYSYDQVHMADFYKIYHDMMAHWRAVLPDRVFDIEYDEMVREPEVQARRIAAHCGLEFHDEMLQVGRNSGVVATASANQIREGIVTNRGGLWRSYERHLSPMIDRLAMHGMV
jgi:tetratricopeptide (TPR) repeat protein